MNIYELGKNITKTEEDDTEEAVSASQAHYDRLVDSMEILEGPKKKAQAVGPHVIPYSRSNDLQQKTLNGIQRIEANTAPRHWAIRFSWPIFLIVFGYLLGVFGHDVFQWLKNIWTN